jgi:hypothetical protein
MEIVTRPLAELESFATNPRVIEDDALARLELSLREFGLFKPLLVWGSTVIGGNQRLRVLRSMVAGDGLPEAIDVAAIPTIVFEGSEAEAKVLALRDNNSDGDWNWDDLPKYIAEIEDMDLALTGFDAETLADLDELLGESAFDLGRYRDGQSSSPDGETDAQPLTGRKSAQFRLGALHGTLSQACYEQWLALFKATGERLDTTDFEEIIGAIIAAASK